MYKLKLRIFKQPRAAGYRVQAERRFLFWTFWADVFRTAKSRSSFSIGEPKIFHSVEDARRALELARAGYMLQLARRKSKTYWWR